MQPEVSYTYRRDIFERVERNDNQPAANSLNRTTGRRHIGDVGGQMGLYYFITNHFSVETNLVRAAFTVSTYRQETATVDNVVNQTGERTDLSARLNLINQLSLDRLLVLNYYF